MQDSQTVDRSVLLQLFESVARIRQFDTRARSAVTSGEAFYIHYPVQGHEIIAAAVAANLTPDDYVTTTYRGIHDEVARGVPLRELWGEYLGRVTGTSKGKGGPMHISDPAHGLMLCTGIVGAGLPIATGLGLANKLSGDGRVTIANFGDGASNIGAFHEALNMASVWDLPVVFVCQNNQYGEHTAFSATQKNRFVVERAAAYGMRGIKVDGTDPVATYLGAKEAIAHARSGQGPVLLECVTFRLLGHVMSDQNEYMDPAVLAEQRANDSVPRFRSWLISEGHATDDQLAAVEAAVVAEVEDAFQQAQKDPLPDVSELTKDIVSVREGVKEPGPAAEPSTNIVFRQAINDALDEAMASDERVIVMGEDVADSAGGGVFKVTGGLSSKYGEDRVRNTPIAEQAIIGASIGAAIAGYRPVAEIMFFDFIGVCFDQLANHAAKLRYMSGGRTPVPMTVRVGMVGGTPIGAQHSQSLEALLMHTPGLKVAYPSTPYDAKGLMHTCIEDEDPCVFVECTMLYAVKGPVPTGKYQIPFGVADIKRPGDDVTVITYGRQVATALKAAEQLAGEGVSVEVIDLRTVAPLDMDTVLASVARTNRAVVLHEAVRTCGPAAEIATRIHEELHGQLAGPVRRVTCIDAPVPTSLPLLMSMYPSPDSVVQAVKSFG